MPFTSDTDRNQQTGKAMMDNACRIGTSEMATPLADQWADWIVR